jgi:hypothetical protein
MSRMLGAVVPDIEHGGAERLQPLGEHVARGRRVAHRVGSVT